jgi:hypothetical protein
MKEIYKNLLASFNNQEGGFSGKKLTIFSIVICIMYGHYKFFNSDNWIQNFVAVLTIDFGTILTLFGINVADKSINKTTNEPSN